MLYMNSPGMISLQVWLVVDMLFNNFTSGDLVNRILAHPDGMTTLSKVLRNLSNLLLDLSLLLDDIRRVCENLDQFCNPIYFLCHAPAAIPMF